MRQICFCQKLERQNRAKCESSTSFWSHASSCWLWYLCISCNILQVKVVCVPIAWCHWILEWFSLPGKTLDLSRRVHLFNNWYSWSPWLSLTFPCARFCYCFKSSQAYIFSNPWLLNFLEWVYSVLAMSVLQCKPGPGSINDGITCFIVCIRL